MAVGKTERMQHPTLGAHVFEFRTSLDAWVVLPLLTGIAGFIAFIIAQQTRHSGDARIAWTVFAVCLVLTIVGVVITVARSRRRLTFYERGVTRGRGSAVEVLPYDQIEAIEYRSVDAWGKKHRGGGLIGGILTLISDQEYLNTTEFFQLTPGRGTNGKAWKMSRTFKRDGSDDVTQMTYNVRWARELIADLIATRMRAELKAGRNAPWMDGIVIQRKGLEFSGSPSRTVVPWSKVNEFSIHDLQRNRPATCRLRAAELALDTTLDCSSPNFYAGYQVVREYLPDPNPEPAMYARDVVDEAAALEQMEVEANDRVEM